MEFVTPLLLGFVIASIGIIPPGLINMTAARVSAIDGRNEAISFAGGATLVVFFQTYTALLFAKFIFSRQDIINILQEIGVVLFSCISVYFFWSARKPKKTKQDLKIHSKASRFFLGVLLSSLNLFPIPYYVFISVTLSSYDYFFFNTSFIYSFVLGVVLGSFSVFYLYILFFKKQENMTSFIIDKGNYIIGFITGLVSVVTFFKLIKHYWT